MNESILEALLLIVIGMSGVFAALFVLMLLIWSMKTIDEKLNTRKIRKYSETIESTPVAVDGVNDEIVAVITAAAMEAFHKPVVVRHLRFLEQPEDESWAASGRITIMSSHTITKK